MSERSPNTVVVGGGGFLGRHICQALRNQSATVTSVSRREPLWSIAGVEDEVADMADITAATPLLRDADVVVSLAGGGFPSSGEPLATQVRQGVEATVGLAEACAAVGVQRFLFASSGGTVYGCDAPVPIQEDALLRPMSAYGASKVSIEKFLGVLDRQTDMVCISLRVANAYGVGQSAEKGQGFIAAALESVRRDEPISIWGDGTVVRDYVWATDIGDAFADATTYAGPDRVFNVGSERGASLNEVVEIINDATGRRLTVDYRPGRSVDVPVNILDVTRARRELGWQPATSLEAGIGRLVAAMEGSSTDATRA